MFVQVTLLCGPVGTIRASIRTLPSMNPDMPFEVGFPLEPLLAIRAIVVSFLAKMVPVLWSRPLAGHKLADPR